MHRLVLVSTLFLLPLAIGGCSSSVETGSAGKLLSRHDVLDAAASGGPTAQAMCDRLFGDAAALSEELGVQLTYVDSGPLPNAKQLACAYDSSTGQSEMALGVNQSESGYDPAQNYSAAATKKHVFAWVQDGRYANGKAPAAEQRVVTAAADLMSGD